MELSDPADSPMVVHSPDGSGLGRKPYLDSLRGIAALLVVLHGAHLECPPVGAWGTGTLWVRQGRFVLTFFIILSGYCLTLPTLSTGGLRDGFLSFLKRRAGRILPAYYAALAGSLLLVATAIGRKTGRTWDTSLPVDLQSILTHVFLVHNYKIEDLFKINHVFWTLAVEWQVYFAFPVLLLLGRKIGIWWTTALAIGLGTLGNYLLLGTAHIGLMPHFYGLFALGMLAATIGHAPAWDYAAKSVSWWTLAALSVLATWSLSKTNSYETLDLTLGVAFAAMLVALSTPSRFRSFLENRWLVTLGGFSFSLYLIHAPLQHLVVEQVFARLKTSRDLEFPLMVLVANPLIIALAYGFNRAIERRFLPKPQETSAIPAPMGLAVGHQAEPVRVDHR